MQPIIQKTLPLLLFVLLFSSCSKDGEEDTSSNKIETSAVTSINYRSAKAGGVISNSKSAIIQGGVCYSTDPNPDITDNITNDAKQLGTFTSYLSQLSANTHYYLRAYMVNNEGTFYGNSVEFTTANYPTENLWYLNENIYVINDQNVITQFKWSVKDTAFIGGDNTTELNLIKIKLKQKPIEPKTYKLSKKAYNLEDDECHISILSARSPYVGTYLYQDDTVDYIQMEYSNNKSKFIISHQNVYEMNDVNKTQPIVFKGILVEK